VSEVAGGAVLAAWRATDVTMGDVLAQLDGLRRAGQRSLANRTSVVTLVVAVRSEAEAGAAVDVVHDFGGRHPARCVVVRAAPSESPAGIDARVSLLQGCSGDHAVWYEDIRLTVRGAAALHLAQLVEPLVLSDLPVAAWFPGHAPSPQDSLVEAADAVIMDSKHAIEEDGAGHDDESVGGALPGTGDLAGVAALFGQQAVVDLAWIRLRPWRELTAALFDGSEYRPFAFDVRSAQVSGKPGARLLLGGWLSSRLGLPSSRLHLLPARHASLRLVAEHEGRTGTFVVERVEGERLVRASAAVDDGPRHTEVLALPEADLSWSLAQGLAHLGRDHVYEDAVHAALALAT
jgi:glucose-6-phosphate dehydrogenase assembly protein OpcA